MALDTGVYAWVRDALHPDLGSGKIMDGATWRAHLIESGAYVPDFAAHEAFSVIAAASIVASVVVAPGAFSAGKSLLPDVTFTLLTGDPVGGIALTVSGSVERLYAHWGKANSGLPFTPDGSTKVLKNLTLEHATVIV